MKEEIQKDLKKVLLAGIGAVAVTSEKASEIAKVLIKKGETIVEQGKVLNEELSHKVKDFACCDKKTGKTVTADSVDVDSMTKEERELLKQKLSKYEA